MSHYAYRSGVNDTIVITKHLKEVAIVDVNEFRQGKREFNGYTLSEDDTYNIRHMLAPHSYR